MDLLPYPDRQFFTLLFCTILLFLAGCGRDTYTLEDLLNESNPPASLDPNLDVSLELPYPHPADWVSPSMHGQEFLNDNLGEVCLACHKMRQGAPDCKSCHSLFPHEENWELANVHGQQAEKAAKEQCQGCHGENFQGNEVPSKNCFSCHDTYPHPENWKNSDQHGALVIDPQVRQEKCATSCHGSKLEGGLSGVACKSCHEGVFPHEGNWKLANIHGQQAEKAAKEKCQVCHGENFQGNEVPSKNCFSCHGTYPHPENWVSSDQHGALSADPKVRQEKCATSCHGTKLEGGLSGVSCKGCHEGVFPHDKGWKTDHRQAYQEFGPAICQQCHGDDFKKVLGDKNCFSCHNYPHLNDWKNSHDEVVRDDLNKNVITCQGCHGFDLAKVKPNGKNCFTCHPSYPHATKTGLYTLEDTSLWKLYEFHGDYTLSHDKSECTQCHGDDLKGGQNPSCYGCHEEYPHAANWGPNAGEANIHKDFVLANTANSCATVRCHGDNLIPGPKTKGPDCRSCHEDYPHSPWNQGWKLSHGQAARADIDRCKTCHGSNLDQFPEGAKTCQECHPSFLKHKSAKIDPAATLEHWPKFEGHAQYIKTSNAEDKMAECRLCHGGDYSGGVTQVSCQSCHPSYPHIPNWDAKVKHGTYTFELTKVDGKPDSCRLCHNEGQIKCSNCHGDDLKGGNSGISCFKCHENYPHIQGHNGNNRWEKGKVHGAEAYDDGKQSCDTVNCHGSSFEGSDLAPSCYECHALYPHRQSDWLSPAPKTEHALTFLKERKTDAKVCSTCHGEDYDRTDEGVRPKLNCERIGCHDSKEGVTHVGQWAKGEGHGFYYSKSNQNCLKCHGEVVGFSSNQQSKADLALNNLQGVPSCYECHTAYPHVSYDNSPWVSTNSPGHTAFMHFSPLFVNAEGMSPAENIHYDTRTIPAIQNTCSKGNLGLCHNQAHEPKTTYQEPVCQECHHGG
ncbi:MAG: hypothetical protein HYU97_08305 [Deltaproteobacteria bacterium]|nr:hypothetical protein [Deltaproteobacteria bacterium]